MKPAEYQLGLILITLSAEAAHLIAGLQKLTGLPNLKAAGTSHFQVMVWWDCVPGVWTVLLSPSCPVPFPTWIHTFRAKHPSIWIWVFPAVLQPERHRRLSVGLWILLAFAASWACFRKNARAGLTVPIFLKNYGTNLSPYAFWTLSLTQQGVVIMAASPQQKPRVVPEYESDYQQNTGGSVPPDTRINQSTTSYGGSTGLIIAALVVVLAILFALSFDWSSNTTAPTVTQENTAPAAPDALAPATPPATPPAAEAPPATPPAGEATTPPAGDATTPPAATPPATTTQ